MTCESQEIVEPFQVCHFYLAIFCTPSLELLDLEAGGQGLLQLLGLLLVGNLEGVQEPGAPDLELDVLGVLLDLDALGVLAPGLQEEVLDLLDFARHGAGGRWPKTREAPVNTDKSGAQPEK